MTEEDKPYISHSQIAMYLRCPEQYRRRYIEHERRPPSIHASRGKGFHGGVEINYGQKIESHQDLPVSQIVDASVAAFEDNVAKEGISLSQEESSKGVKRVVGEAKDMTVRLARFYGEKVAGDYQPTLVEKSIRIVLPDSPKDLLAVVDIADDQDQVIDMKTKARSQNKDEADKSDQLTIYSIAYRANTGRPTSRVILDTIVDAKGGVKRQVLPSERDGEDVRALSNKINAVIGAIEKGIFVPAPVGSWWCSETWCGYWNDCPYVNPKRFVQVDLGKDKK